MAIPESFNPELWWLLQKIHKERASIPRDEPVVVRFGTEDKTIHFPAIKPAADRLTDLMRRLAADNVLTYTQRLDDSIGTSLILTAKLFTGQGWDEASQSYATITLKERFNQLCIR